MEKIKIFDDSGDKKYFTIIPNYIYNHSTIWDREVYSQMKRIAGEDGTCWMSQNNLAKQCGISLNRLKKSLRYLLKKGWIKIIGEKIIQTKGGAQKVIEYSISNLWKLNIDYYEKGGSSDDIPYKKGESRKSQRGVTDDAKGVSPESYKEEPCIKKNHFKEEREAISKEIARPLNVSNNFFKNSKNQEKVISMLVGKKIPEDCAREEVKKFVLYWTEPNHSGTRERWQLEKTFDIRRRLIGWFSRINQYKGREFNNKGGVFNLDEEYAKRNK